MLSADTAREISETLGSGWDELREVARTAPSRYHVYPLQMGKKIRWIEAPDRELKSLQRRLLDKVLYSLTPTPWAHGFIKGRSIVSNAAAHCGREWVISLDIKDFFPSVTRESVVAVLSELHADSEQCQILGDIVTRRHRLPQGAPTSPHLANLTVRTMDRRLHAMARARGWNYTRYADDMSFSGDGKYWTVLAAARDIVSSEGFRLAERKTTIRGRHQRQSVTGLVVNEKVSIPREKRRLLRAMLHKVETTGLTEAEVVESLSSINGHLAFLAMVSPGAFRRQRGVLNALVAGEAD